MIILNSSLQKISAEKTLRYDVDYSKYYQRHTTEYCSFNDLFSFPDVIEIDVSNLEEDFLYCEIGDVNSNGEVMPVTLNFTKRQLEMESYYKKIEKGDILLAQPGDILISKVRPNLKKIVFITNENCNIYYTSAFIRIRPQIIPKILYYCLRSIFIDDINALSRQGKGYPTISESDLMTLKFDQKIIDKLLCNAVELEKTITKLEKNIDKYKGTIKRPYDIINDVFSEVFKLDYSKIKDIDDMKLFSVQTSRLILENQNARFSCRWNKAFSSQEVLRKSVACCEKLKKYIVSANNGWSPECNEIATIYKVLSLDSIEKNGVLQTDKVKFTDISRSNVEKFFVKEGDLFVSRGNGTDELIAMASVAGKIDSESEPIIYPDIMIKINLSEEVSSHYVAYAINSYFGRMYFKNVAKGSNKKKITPFELGEFVLPCPELSEQERVVSIIQKKVREQERVNIKIEGLRCKIYDAVFAKLSQ
ncbi:MAG: hypothetical protein K2H52_13730 [Lachnospiraceae bacterium]|nr:hypothetical protein [Lachnospiraceae bacterium]